MSSNKMMMFGAAGVAALGAVYMMSNSGKDALRYMEKPS